ncbi:MAG: 50S ribosomal protein L11 methyltransferase [Gammaproteobacteria bacterium]
MPWQQLSVITSEQIAPAVADLFSELGALSVTYMDAADDPVYEPKPGETQIWRHTKVIALFDAEYDADSVKTAVNRRFADHSPESWQQEILQDQDWERSWMEYYQPMRFGKRLWVCPTGQERREAGCTCLILDPGLAFGTGTHPTTALCLEWLAEHDVAGKTVIDFGCGSGILAIAAVLLGAKEAHAVDIDPQALEATRDNALKNAVADKVYTYLPEQFRAFEADIVLANILANPLIELSAHLASLVKTDGMLVLSGILQSQAAAVGNAYGAHFALAEPVMREEWCRLDARKIC